MVNPCKGTPRHPEHSEGPPNNGMVPMQGDPSLLSGRRRIVRDKGGGRATNITNDTKKTEEPPLAEGNLSFA